MAHAGGGGRRRRSPVCGCCCRRGWRRRLSAATAVVALVACLAGPLAYSAQTISSAHTGSVPSAGPAAAGGGGPGGGGFAGGGSAHAGGRATRRTLAVRVADSHAWPVARGGTPGFRAAPDRPRRGRRRGEQRAGRRAEVRRLRATAGWQRHRARRAPPRSSSPPAAIPVMAIGGFNGQGGNLIARPVRGIRQGRRYPLLPRFGRRLRWRRPGRWLELERDHELGQGPLSVRDDRGADGLRPDPAVAVIDGDCGPRRDGLSPREPSPRDPHHEDREGNDRDRLRPEGDQDHLSVVVLPEPEQGSVLAD